MAHPTSKPAYVLVTPVRNEEKTIQETLDSVVKQSIHPLEWIIVSDQSNDGTDEIVKRYAAVHSFIRLLRLENRPSRSFASVVFVTESGINSIQSKDYDFIGLLDADVRFSEDYFEKLIERFYADLSLGLAGGLAVDIIDGKRQRVGQSLSDVAGAVQFFRRACFEALGGLVAIPEGGWDTLTCVQARMHGYRTATFPDLIVDHLKPRNIAEGNIVQRFRQLGIREYALGNHPLFELLKCAYRCLQRPFIIGGMLRLSGYVSCYLKRRKRLLPEAIIRQIRREQLRRLHLLPRGKSVGPKSFHPASG